MFPAGRRLRRLAEEADSPEALVELSYDFRYALDGIAVAPWQERSEILALLRLLDENPPRTVLEIGTAGGGTLFLLTRSARRDATLISVDLPRGMFGGGYPLSRVPLYRSFALPTQSLHLLRGDSHDAATRERVVTILAGRPLDLLFIDGDHTYEGVRQDFEIYAPLVRDGGLIVLHDIVPGAPGIGRWAPGHRVGHVPRFWQEIRARHETIELVKDWNQGGLGLGVVVAGDPMRQPVPAGS